MNWQAKWIWAESLAEARNCYVYARREFEAPATPSAEAYVTCSSAYKLYANGKYVGRGPSACDDPESQHYDTHDLSHILRPGKNVIAAICHYETVENSSQPPAGLLLQLEICHNGDDKTILCTDEAWRVTPADEWEPSPDFAEVYDSRRKPVGWNVVGFDDGEWQQPRILADPGYVLVPRQIPLLKEWEVHPQQVVSAVGVRYAREMLTPTGEVAMVNPGADATVMLDFGMEVVGFPGIRIRGGGCGSIDLDYAEALDAAGSFYAEGPYGLEPDRLILHGGRQEWQTFGRKEFRYVQLTFRNLDTPVSIESVYLTRIGYPVEQVSTFECSDDLLNEIWRTGVYTLSLCMQDCYDEPMPRVQALINYYCFFDSALAAQALEQRADLAPSMGDGLEWVEMLHDYYLHTADIGPIQQLYPHLVTLVDEPRFDWDGAAESCAFHCHALRSASQLAVAVSNTEDALRWHEQSVQVRKTFNERFWRENGRAYIHSGEDVHEEGGEEDEDVRAGFLAIAFGMVDPEKTRKLWETVSKLQLETICAPYHYFFVLQALAKLDKTQEALDLIRGVWGAMLAHGATTWWSSYPWDDYWTPANGLCHGSSGAPTYFLPAEILGVKPGLPGSEVVIQPRAGDLQWAKGHIKTIAGYADVEWHNEDGVFTIDIEAPDGFIVGLPTGGLTNPMVDEMDLTPETPERRARKTYGWGNTIWRDGLEHDPYLDWLATQEAEPPGDYERRERCSTGGCYIWVRESVSKHVRYEVREG